MLQKLNEREKIFVLGGGALMIAMFIGWGILRYFQYRADLSDRVNELPDQIARLKKYGRQYQELRQQEKKIPLKPDMVLPEIETLLKNNNLREKASSLLDSKNKESKYTKTTVKLNLASVDFNILAKFLYDVEEVSEYFFRIEYLRLRRRPNYPGQYDARMNIVSYFESK